jgi:DNA replication and repair protein RecF
MILTSVKIEHFKNYEKAELLFGEEINCLTGPNGAGKTNILDAIYYLCTGKSYFNPQDSQLIQEGAEYFSLKGDFLTEPDQNDTVLCVLIKGRRKVIKRNDDPYTRLTDHYGNFPVVMIAPGDIELILGGSEERRRWMDSVISWIDHDYLNALLKYEKILQQRNAELRNAEQGATPEILQLIRVYDEMIIPLAESIFRSRKLFMEEFLPYFNAFQKEIAGQNENASLQYLSAMHETRIAVLLNECLKKDIILQRTGAGPHKDDLDFLMDANPLKRYGSQGQQKTFLLALKLAQYRYLESKKNRKPVLLLDDVCERLDEHRLSVLFRLIGEKDKFGQVFVTDTSEERVHALIGKEINTRMFSVIDGNIMES